MNTTYPRDGDTPSENGGMQDLLRRFSVLEQNQRDMLFLLRSMRVELSPETRRIHREAIRMPPFNGLCPCCLQTKIVADDGTLIPPVEFDHFWGPVYTLPRCIAG